MQPPNPETRPVPSDPDLNSATHWDPLIHLAHFPRCVQLLWWVSETAWHGTQSMQQLEMQAIPQGFLKFS